jgi:uncharacterized damage-inducible protein DinB
MPVSLARLTRWNAWANRQVLETLRRSGGAPVAALAAFKHCLATEKTWLARMDGDPDAFYAAWSEPSLAECEEWFSANSARLAQLSEQLASGSYETEMLEYRSSSGEPFATRIDDILMHTFMHSMQYRGEAAGFLNHAGFRCPDIDLMFWERAGEPV